MTVTLSLTTPAKTELRDEKIEDADDATNSNDLAQAVRD
jgi:hypothetical protein